MSDAKLILDGQEYEFPVFSGTENEKAVDMSTLRAKTKAVAFDPGFGNVGSCKSAITFINGEKGILRYRGYPIEELANKASFSEVCYLLVHGHLPDQKQSDEWSRALALNSFLREDMMTIFGGFPSTTHPMVTMSAMIASLSAFYPTGGDDDELENENAIRLLAKTKTIAAYSYKKLVGEPFMYPKADLSYAGNLLRMMFATPAEEYELTEECEQAMNSLLILHADHEQNCSTSTVRMVSSSHANLFASMSAGVGALWGPLHGGANQAVIEMLEQIHNEGLKPEDFVTQVKDKKSNRRLMGFGHRVYKNFDPRAQILKKACDKMLEKQGVSDPLLDIAKYLEQVALEDDYFIERKLYANVDFYSGIIYRAMGIPTDMFTVMFAIGRMPGWIAHWKELRSDPKGRIHRPRQIYTGETERPFVPLAER